MDVRQNASNFWLRNAWSDIQYLYKLLNFVDTNLDQWRQYQCDSFLERDPGSSFCFKILKEKILM